jgi:putative methanogenesis marker protein 3
VKALIIHLDGTRLEMPEGTTLQDIVPNLDTACSIVVIRPGEEEAAETRSIRVSTTAGEVVIELTATGTEGTGALFTLPACESGEETAGLPLGWADRYSASFGPFPSEIRPARVPEQYAEGDVILGCGGYDPRRSYFIFSRMRHNADHGAAPGGGVIGRVVSGKSMLARWSAGDRIECVERIISREDRSRAFTTTDRSVPLEDGMQVISHVSVIAEGMSPSGTDTTVAESVEHLLLALEDGRFSIGRSASTHVRDDRLAGTDTPFQKRVSRLEGTVTVRTRGTCRGCVYIYTTDTPGSAAHTVVGRVAHGIELVRFAGEGEQLCIRSEPPRLEFLGMALREAEALAAERGIELSVDDRSGERVVIGQDPATTLEVLAAGTARLMTVPLTDVIAVRLDDENAPVTCAIFRTVSGLKLHNVGMLPILYTFEDVYLFKPKMAPGTKITLENLPSGEVPANTLAMTNDSRKGTGIVGVRTTANGEFGPTSEPFEGTNIIGTVLEPEKLQVLGEGKVVFIREIKS